MPRKSCSVAGTWRMEVASVHVVLLSLFPLTTPLEAQILADSARDFSRNQGHAGWLYGHFTSPFTPDTFQLLPIYGTNTVGNVGWMLTLTPPPWTRITASSAHPSAPNDSSIPVQWAVRRWQSPVNGVIRISGSIAKASTNASTTQDGITGHILVDGTPVYTQAVARNDTFGHAFSLEVPVAPGSLVDFAVSPNGNDRVDVTIYRTTIALADPPARWVAFNDHHAGPRTHARTTAWNAFTNLANAPGNSGPLKDMASGAILPVTLAITNRGVGRGAAAAGPTNGTMGYSLFQGFVDFGTAASGVTNHSILVSAADNDVVAFVFAGLSPTNEYRFRGTAARGDPAYTNRWTLAELTGATSFSPAHTEGVLTSAVDPALGAAEGAFNTGDNSLKGDVIGWDRIRPASNGTFTVLCRQYTNSLPAIGVSTAGAPYSYAFTAIRLSEYSSASPPVIASPQLNGSILKMAFSSEPNREYVVEYQEQLTPGDWQVLTAISGTGGTITVKDVFSNAPARFYRVRIK
jgi:hypothetical protein